MDIPWPVRIARAPMTGQDFSKESGLHLTKHEIQNRVAVNYEEELVPKYSWAAKKIFNTEEHRG